MVRVWHGLERDGAAIGNYPTTVPSRVEVGVGLSLMRQSTARLSRLAAVELGSSRRLFRRQAVPHELSRELWFEREWEREKRWRGLILLVQQGEQRIECNCVRIRWR